MLKKNLQCIINKIGGIGSDQEWSQFFLVSIWAKIEHWMYYSFILWRWWTAINLKCELPWKHFHATECFATWCGVIDLFSITQTWVCALVLEKQSIHNSASFISLGPSPHLSTLKCTTKRFMMCCEGERGREGWTHTSAKRWWITWLNNLNPMVLASNKSKSPRLPQKLPRLLATNSSIPNMMRKLSLHFHSSLQLPRSYSSHFTNFIIYTVFT